MEYVNIKTSALDKNVPTKETNDALLELKGNTDSIILHNVSVTSDLWTAVSGMGDFGFVASIPVSGCTANYVPNVVLDLASAISGNFAPVSESGTDVVKIYAKEKPTADITIPTIICLLEKKDSKLYTITIDQNNSDPLTCCAYQNDAVGMTKGSDAWDEIFGIKPCVLKNGAVYKYVNPNDFTKYVDGSSVSSSDGDVMIEFPRFGMNLENDGNGVITVSMSTDTNAFGNDGLDTRVFGSKNKFYLGAYLASNAQNGLLSVSGVAPETNINLTNAIAYAQKKGSGYDIMGFYQWTYVQCLYLLKYGNLNSQVALGKGYVSGSAKQNTGATNTQGMCYGDPTSGTDRVKLFGLEDAWGNLKQWLGGLYCDNSYNLLTKTSNFTTGTAASNYDYSTPSGLSSSVYSYMKQLQGTNGGGFVGKQSGGSSITYWSDSGDVNAGYFAFVGGHWSLGDLAGLFFCDVVYDASDAGGILGCRLQYL